MHVVAGELDNDHARSVGLTCFSMVNCMIPFHILPCQTREPRCSEAEKITLAEL